MASPQLIDFQVTQVYNPSRAPWLLKADAGAHEHDYADSDHTHSQSDITGLVEALAQRSLVTHTHKISGITNLQNTLNVMSAATEAVFNRILVNDTGVLVGNGNVLYGPA